MKNWDHRRRVYVDIPPANMAAVMVAIPRLVSRWQWNRDEEAVADWKSICSSSFSIIFVIGSSFMPVVFLSWLWSIFQLFFESRLVLGLRIVGDLSIPGKRRKEIDALKSTFFRPWFGIYDVIEHGRATDQMTATLGEKYRFGSKFAWNRIGRSCFAIGKRFVLRRGD